MEDGAIKFNQIGIWEVLKMKQQKVSTETRLRGHES